MTALAERTPQGINQGETTMKKKEHQMFDVKKYRDPMLDLLPLVRAAVSKTKDPRRVQSFVLDRMTGELQRRLLVEQIADCWDELRARARPKWRRKSVA